MKDPRAVALCLDLLDDENHALPALSTLGD